MTPEPIRMTPVGVCYFRKFIVSGKCDVLENEITE